uniref:Uncharacterized protein n=1 Tax=Pseudomonas phage HRDY3 TaxID=3236930 RepID=A0AB39CDW4_9VIRU
MTTKKPKLKPKHEQRLAQGKARLEKYIAENGDHFQQMIDACEGHTFTGPLAGRIK